MAGRSRSTWLPFSLLLLAGAATAGEVRFSGPPRFFSGRTATRSLFGLPETVRTVHWRLTAYSAEIAKGEAEVSAGSPELPIAVPAADRAFPATLVVRGAGPAEIRLDVEVSPSRADEIGRLLADSTVGVLGSIPGGLFGAETVALTSPGAIRRFPGTLVVLAPGDHPVSPYVAALLDYARRGGHVLDLGADRAPWVDPGGDRPDGALARQAPLRPGGGNHLERRGGLVREGFVGAGRLTLARLTLAEIWDEDPLAEELFLDVLNWTLAPTPRLRTPRAVICGEDDEELAGLFAAGDAGVVTVVSAKVADARDVAKRSSPALLVGPEGTVFFDGEKVEEGPGMSNRSAFLRSLTDRGIRVKSERPWR